MNFRLLILRVAKFPNLRLVTRVSPLLFTANLQPLPLIPLFGIQHQIQMTQFELTSVSEKSHTLSYTHSELGNISVSIGLVDVKDKVLLSIIKALMLNGNRPATPRELARIIQENVSVFIIIRTCIS